MYVTKHRQRDGGQHLHVAVERGCRPGTWEVRFEPAGWRVRSPDGHEQVLGTSESWIGEAGKELEELIGRVSRRAVAEAMCREGSTRRRTPEEVPSDVRAVA